MSAQSEWLAKHTNLSGDTITAVDMRDNGVPISEIAKRIGRSVSGTYGRLSRADGRWMRQHTTKTGFSYVSSPMPDDAKFSEIDIPVRARNALLNHGCSSVGDFRKALLDPAFHRTPNLGKKTTALLCHITGTAMPEKNNG